MTRRLLALALLLPALFAFACASEDTTGSPTVPPAGTQAAPTVSVQATSTPGSRPVTPASTPAANAQASPAPATIAAPPATVAPSASGSTVTVPFPFENAVQARASLLGNARFGPPMDQLDSSDPLDLAAYPGWARTYPALKLAGPSVNATPQMVSVYRNPLRDKEAASSSNPKLIVFTVMDTKGACAAGVIRGYPAYSEYETVDIGTAACNAASALAVLRR